MIRDRIILQAIKLHYKGDVGSVSVSLDGSTKSTVTDLPDHSVHRTRRMSLPAGLSGFVPQFSTGHSTKIDADFEAVPASAFTEQQIWHYYEVIYTGTVNISVYIDENIVVTAKELTLPNVYDTTTPKQTHTQKVYLPPLSFGYVPHVFNATSDAGDIISAKPVTLPVAHYRGVRAVAEGQITYIGDLQVQFYMDGRELGGPYQFNEQTYSTGLPKYVTEKFYFPAGSIGHIFQWEQISGTGNIAMLETDASMASGPEEPQTVEH
tara:strand:+ start:311 stop:1105 length:795 start_codon:yes stop_codon:yes gene_type:complete